MSLFAPSAECRRLANVDPNLRFGVGHLPGQGLTFALVQLIDPNTVAGKLVFNTKQVPDWQHLQGRDGRIEQKLGARVPVLVQWVGQTWGNKAVMTGDYVDAVIYQSKPNHVYEVEREKSVRAKGKSYDDYVEDASREMVDYHKYLGRDGTGSDYIYDRAHVLRELKKDYSQEYVKNLERDKSITFEHQFAKDAGF